MVMYTTSELEEMSEVIENMNPRVRYVIVSFHTLLFVFIILMYFAYLVSYINSFI